jgi:arsenite oxidase small subunit
VDRRDFIESCSKSAACLGAAALPSSMAWAANTKPRDYAKAVLCNALGEPIKASSLKANTNYLFHYPFEATPVFLLKFRQSGAAQIAQHQKQRVLQLAGWGGAKPQHCGVFSDLRTSFGLSHSAGQLYQFSQK